MLKADDSPPVVRRPRLIIYLSWWLYCRTLLTYSFLRPHEQTIQSAATWALSEERGDKKNRTASCSARSPPASSASPSHWQAADPDDLTGL